MDLKKYIQKIIKDVLNEQVEINLKQENNSLQKVKIKYRKIEKDFMNSKKSFKDINDDDIHKIIDFFGYEGYSSYDRAFEDMEEKIDYYKKMPNPVTLYRIIGVKNKKMIKTNDLGEHFTPFSWNIDTEMLLSIGYEDWEEGAKPYVVVTKVPLNKIDMWQTIIQNLSFPHENEITLKDNGKGAKIIKIYKL